MQQFHNLQCTVFEIHCASWILHNYKPSLWCVCVYTRDLCVTLTISSTFMMLRTVSADSLIAEVETSRGCTTFSSRMSVMVPCNGGGWGVGGGRRGKVGIQVYEKNRMDILNHYQLCELSLCSMRSLNTQKHGPIAVLLSAHKHTH